MVRGPPLGASLGLHWGLNTTQKRRRRSFDEVSDANCLKKWFLKDVLNEITSFGVHETPNVYLKGTKTLTLAYKCSIFDVSYKKHLSTTRKLWNHQNTCKLHCFGRKPSFVAPPGHLSWASLGPQHGSEASQKWVLMRSYMRVARKLDFWRMSFTKSLFLLFHGPPKVRLESAENEILVLNTLIKWSLGWY